MDSASIAARSGPAVWLVQLVKWEAKGFTGLWCSGGYVVWNGEVYLDRTPQGVIGELPPFEDGIDGQTTRYNLSIFPPDLAVMADIADRRHQKTRVTIWDAVMDAESGQIIGQPDRLFGGYVDLPRIFPEKMEVILECGTDEALLNEPNEQRRLSHSHHSHIWPGEQGLIHVTGLGRKIFWRSTGGPSASGGYVSGGGGASGGGMGGGTTSREVSQAL